MEVSIDKIPDGWELKSLNDICIKIQDGNYGGQYPKASEFLDYGIPFLTSKVIGKDGILKNELIDYISFEKHVELDKAHLQLNDVLLTNRGASVGAIGYVDKSISHGNIGPQLTLLRVKPDIADSRYLFQAMKSKHFRNQLSQSDSGSAMNFFGVGTTKSFKVKIPKNINEQTAIATALSDTDALITSLERLIEKKRNIKQGAMQQLLTGKKRLPGFSGKWEVKKLEDLIFSFQNGYGFSAEGYDKVGTPIVTMAQIGLDGSFQFDENKVNYWRTSEFNSLKSFHLHNGDVIIAMTDVTPEKNLIGRMTTVKSNQTMLLNQRVGHLRIDKSKISPLFLTSLSNMKTWRDYSISSATLGVQANIGTKGILNGKFFIAPIEEQSAISQVLSDMDAELESLERKLEKYKLIKQGMMQELLSGKTRLV